jgi:membrane peptidoglycan carboxypeptidase
VARVLLVGVLSLVVGMATFIGGLLAAPIDFAVAPPPTAALLVAADGRQFATILPPERREVVQAADIPQVMRDAIISAEDERFLKHSGVDPLATIRAAFRDLVGGKVAQGGSTLTQQYVKNAYVGKDRTALRKVREAALAVRLEQKLSKEAILTDYLNALYLGNGLYGVQAASKYYFGVPVKDLDLDRRTGKRDPVHALARASIMAGIAPAPSVWNPVRDFATARARQQYTLNRMVVGRYITPQQASEAYASIDVKPLRLSPPEPPTVAPEFADYVKAKIKSSAGYDEDVFFRGGLRVRTTLDLDLQVAFNRALKEVLPDATDPQAAIVAVDYRNGDIKAMATRRVAPALVDGNNKVVKAAVKSYEPRFGFNLATNAQRSTGSTIKPFTLAVALQHGLTLDTTRTVPNCLSINNPGGFPNPYRLCNADKYEAGTFSLRRALADSVNTVYGPLATEVGRSKVAALAKSAGLVGRIASLPLSFGVGGSVEVTPLSEAVAYGTFANGGVHVSPRTFTEIRSGASGTDPGQVLERVAASPTNRVMSKSVADGVVSALTDVVQSGTGTAARQSFPVFGKTGTTNDSTDAWFTACIPDQHLCVATWMGYEYSNCQIGKASEHLRVDGPCGGMKNLHSFKQVFGGTLPAQVFARAQQILRQIKAERAARALGLPIATPTPSATHKPLPTATAKPSATPTKTVVPKPTKTVAPTIAPTSPPPLLPTPPPSPPPPSPSG